MSVFNQELKSFEEEIDGFNQRPLGLEDLKKACRARGLVLLVEPFPGPGLYFLRRGVPVITVNSRLDPRVALFMGFMGLFLHHLGLRGLRFFRDSQDLDGEELLAGSLASVTLIPSYRLLDPLPEKDLPDWFKALLTRLIDLRIRSLLGQERIIRAEQAL